jgi:hypothetical protein
MLRQSLHAHEEAATLAIAPGPVFNVFVQLPPSAQIEISNAEISPMGDA